MSETENKNQSDGESAPSSSDGSSFLFVVGETYETQDGEKVKVLKRTGREGYECIDCSDGRFRYDRSTHSEDAGRVTGTAHDYSHPKNFKR